MSKIKHRYRLFLLMTGIFFCLLPVRAQAADGGDKSGGFLFNQSGYDPSVPGKAELPGEETVYTAGGGQIIWTPEKDGGGNIVRGRLTLRNAVINNTYSGDESNYGTGIWMPVPFELVLEGDNRITATGYGIMLSDAGHSKAYGISIRGSGTLTIDSRHEGIWAEGAVTMDAAKVDVTYGFVAGISSEQGDILIQNGSRVTVNSSASASVSGAAVITKNGGNVIIKDSHAIINNRIGAAVSARENVEFLSSDVRITGQGTAVSCGNSANFTVSGGSLYTKCSGGYDLPLSGCILKDSAVIYCGGSYNYLVQQGDSIQYADCVYDEAADQITSVGNGNIYGNVNWNQYVLFPQGANKRLYIGMGGSTLTIPKGVTAEIPDGATLQNSYSGTQHGTLLNYGILNVAAGGTLYNYDSSGGSHGVVTKNYGEIHVKPGGTILNSTILENNGIINSEGNIRVIQANTDGTPYSGRIQNAGTINGFVSIQENGALRYRAEGNTVLTSGKMLTLGTGTFNSGQWDTVLEIPVSGQLTIAEGAVVDAKTHVTKENLLIYLKAEDPIIVDGLLLLPEDVSEEDLRKLSGVIRGKGIVRIGNTDQFIIVFDKGTGSTEAQFLTAGSQITPPADPARSGYRFEGWYMMENGAEVLFDEEMTVSESITIYAKWQEIPGAASNPGGAGAGAGSDKRPVFRQIPGRAAQTGDPADYCLWIFGAVISLLFIIKRAKHFTMK